MSTVQIKVINRALRLLGQLPQGESPSPDESDAALLALNAWIDAKNLDRSVIYALREESLTLSSGTASYTIGADGSPSLNTARPVEIREAWIVDNNITYSMVPMTEEEYAAIPDKTTQTDFPDRFLFRATYPNATLIVQYVPNATRTMKLLTRTPLTALALSDTLAAPRGYERAFAFNLAVELAPEYPGSSSTPEFGEVRSIANASMRAIKIQATPPARSRNELSVLVGNHSAGNILSGG